MPTFKKKILGPATYKVEGSDVPLTTDNFRGWVNNFKKLTKAGYSLPAPFYHNKKSEPVRLKPNQKDIDAYNNGGWWKRLWVSKKDGALWGEIDVPDEEKAKKITSGEIFEVSPAVRATYETAELGTLKDVITHIAMVTQPVAGSQEPFTIAASRCFARSMTSGEPDGSWDFQSDSSPPKKKPAPDGERMPSSGEEEQGDSKKPGGAQKKGGVVLKGDEEDERGMNVPDAAGAGFEDALQILQDLGLVLPADTDESNFIERLITAGCAIRGKGTGGMKEQPSPPQHGATFSREGDEMADVPTNDKKEVDPAVQLELSKYKATKAWAENVATEAIKTRIKALKLTDEFQTKHIAPLLAAHELVFSNEGAIVPGTLDIVLAALEDYKPADEKKVSPFFMSRQLETPTGGELHQPPKDAPDAPRTMEDVDALLDSVPALKARMS